MNRRDLLGSIALGGGATLLTSRDALAEAFAPKAGAAYAQAVRGTGPVKIRDIKTILTAPNRIRLVVVKVETTEPGLFGWGCATFTQRALVVQTAIDQYLRPFLIGRNVDEIEDIWQSSYMSSVLAQRRRPLQCDERRRHRAVGHQGQARRHAALSAARRQGAARRRLLLPLQRRQLHRG